MNNNNNSNHTLENEVKVLWDINIQSENVIEVRRADIIVIDKKGRRGVM